LLSHTSSIRDAGESYIIRYPRRLREAFDPEASEYPDRFQPCGEQDRGPSVFYEYCNLNSGVIGSILERVTNTRFYLLMRQRLYQPLDLAGGFNVAAFSTAEKNHLAALYRKRDRNGTWNPQGPWVSQVDDLSEGIPTALPEEAVYTPGTNGAQFSPQGGARLSLGGLEALAMLLLGDGKVGHIRLLSPLRMQDLRDPSWQFDSNRPNMDGHAGRLHARTAGLRIISGLTAEDSLFNGDARRWYGHFGEAYGLLAGVWVEPDSGQGVIYAITGTAFDPYGEPGSDTKALLPIESKVVNALAPLLTR
jgi:CubicO group peptidase (beta-lactamase class C family)